MWKWVGVACLIYGLSSLGLMFSPRPAPPGGSPMIPGTGPGPGGPPAAIDFEGQFPPPITRPPSDVQVMEGADGNHVLDWRLPPEGSRLHSLALPMRPHPGAKRLVLNLGARRTRELRIGLREEDGSVYLAPREIGEEMHEISIPFGEMQLAEVAQDENGQLDPEQVLAVVIICPELRMMRDRRGPAVITLDNVRFE